MNRQFRIVLAAAIALGAAGAVWVAAIRWSAEASRRSVEMIADWTQVQQTAVLSNVPMEMLLAKLRDHGIGGMAVSEDTIAGLRDDGFLIVEADPTAAGGARTILSSIDHGLLERVQEHLSHKVAQRAPLQAVRSKEGYPAFIWPGSFEQIRSVNVGLPPAEVARLRRDGFDVVARIVNYQAATRENIDWSLRNLTRLGVRKVIFGGEEVLGYQAEIKETADLLRRDGLVYGSVEFSKQRGDEDLSLALNGDYLRVHSILPAEMSKLKPEEMIERYVRAAEERNVRLAFVRLLPFVTARGWDDQIQFLDDIGRGMRRAGLTLGPAAPYPPRGVSRVARCLVGLGAAAAAAWLLASLVPLADGTLILVFLAAALLHVALILGTRQTGAKLVALEAAIVLPTLAMTNLYGLLRRSAAEDRPFSPVAAFLTTTMLSLTGALYVVGMLSSREYMVQALQFTGIKAAHVLPLALLAVALGLDTIVDHRARREMMTDAAGRFRDWVSEPIRIWQLVAAVCGLAALALLVLRTGNDPGVGVSPMEMRFRAILDRVLFVRPRTKEFLIGHPALILALGWSWAQSCGRKSAMPVWRLTRSGLVLLLLIGAIGQVSMVNTFCHIHTPLAVSGLRVVNGLWVGALIGFALLRLLPRRRDAAADAEPVATGRGPR